MAKKFIPKPHLKKAELRKLSERIEPMPTALELANLSAALVQAGILKQQVVNEGWTTGRDVANDALRYWQQCARTLRITREVEICGEHERGNNVWRIAFVGRYSRDGRIDVTDVVRLAGFDRLTLTDEQLKSVGITAPWKRLHPSKRWIAIFKYLTAQPLKKCELCLPHMGYSRFVTLSLARVKPGEAEELDRRVPPVRMDCKTHEVLERRDSNGKSPSLSEALGTYDAMIKKDRISTEHHPDGTTKTQVIKGLDELAVINERLADYVQNGIPEEVFDKVLDLMIEAKCRFKSTRNANARKGKTKIEKPVRKPRKKDSEGKFIPDAKAKDSEGRYKKKSRR